MGGHVFFNIHERKYELPKICARCGIKKGELSWKIKGEYSGVAAFSLGTKNYIFSVPACNACKTILTRHQMKSRFTKVFSTTLGMLIIGIHAFSLTHDNSAVTTLGRIVFGGLLGFYPGNIIGEYLRVPCSSGLGSYSGRLFYFRNQNFHRQFSKLNPSLIRNQDKL
jgi:hypothetical protein